MGLYTREDFIEAYVATKRPSARDVADWQAKRLAALERAFGVRLGTPDGARSRALWLLFDAAAESAAKVSAPFASFLEAGLVTKRLDEAGVCGRRIDDLAKELDQLARRSADLHRRMLRELFDLLWSPEGTVTSDDLRQHGFDDTVEAPGQAALA